VNANLPRPLDQKVAAINGWGRVMVALVIIAIAEMIVVRLRRRRVGK
jgi:hypothetical protein